MGKYIKPFGRDLGNEIEGGQGRVNKCRKRNSYIIILYSYYIP